MPPLDLGSQSLEGRYNYMELSKTGNPQLPAPSTDLPVRFVTFSA